MFSKLALILSIALAVAALPRPGDGPKIDQCNTGTVACCNQMTSINQKDAVGIFGVLDGLVQGANVPLGIQCSPVTAAGVGGSNGWFVQLKHLSRFTNLTRLRLASSNLFAAQETSSVRSAFFAFLSW